MHTTLGRATAPHPGRIGLPVSLVVADDSAAYLAGLIRTLRGDPRLQVVAAVPDGRQALEAIARLRPVLALLDVTMPHLSGLEVCDAVRQRLLPTRMWLLSARFDPALTAAAAAAGATGALDKALARTDIVDALLDSPPRVTRLPVTTAPGWCEAWERAEVVADSSG